MKIATDRDDFTPRIKEIMKQRAAFICSNPNCKKMTIGPSAVDDTKVQYMGKCAHITAAREGGPRFDMNLSSEERGSVENGIFLCSNCADLIDKNNGIDYEITTLKNWRDHHLSWVTDNLNKSFNEAELGTSISSIGQRGGITAKTVNLVIPQEKPTNTANLRDTELFESSEKVASETELIQLTNSLLDRQSIWSTQMDKLQNLVKFFDIPSNHYINSNIEENHKIFMTQLRTLNTFLVYNFDMWPYDQKGENYKICLDPKNNVDQAGIGGDVDFRRYHKLAEELLTLTESFKLSYSKLRREVRLALHI